MNEQVERKKHTKLLALDLAHRQHPINTHGVRHQTESTWPVPLWSGGQRAEAFFSSAPGSPDAGTLKSSWPCRAR